MGPFSFEKAIFEKSIAISGEHRRRFLITMTVIWIRAGKTGPLEVVWEAAESRRRLPMPEPLARKFEAASGRRLFEIQSFQRKIFQLYYMQ
jgi:hypothetical protein